MSDLAIIWNPQTGYGDLNLVGAQLQSGQDLETAILVSIFTDRVAMTDDAIIDGTNDPRGWWGDTGRAYPVGSRLWLLERAKQTQETAQLAKDYLLEALQWLIDDGAVGRFDITTQWIAAQPGTLGAWLIAYKPDGTTLNLQYAWTWNGIS